MIFPFKFSFYICRHQLNFTPEAQMRGKKIKIHMKNIQQELCDVQCVGSQFSQEKTQHIHHSQECRDIYWQSSQTWP